MTDEEIALVLKTNLSCTGWSSNDYMLRQIVAEVRSLIEAPLRESLERLRCWYNDASAERDRLVKENDNLRSTLYQEDAEAYPEWESLYAAEAQERTQLVADRTRLRSALVRIAETGGWVTFTAGDGELGLRNDARGMATEALDGEA